MSQGTASRDAISSREVILARGPGIIIYGDGTVDIPEGGKIWVDEASGETTIWTEHVRMVFPTDGWTVKGISVAELFARDVPKTDPRWATKPPPPEPSEWVKSAKKFDLSARSFGEPGAV